jgi:hypothetical protein
VRGQIKKDQLHVILSVVGTPKSADLHKTRTDKVSCANVCCMELKRGYLPARGHGLSALATRNPWQARQFLEEVTPCDPLNLHDRYVCPQIVFSNRSAVSSQAVSWLHCVCVLTACCPFFKFIVLLLTRPGTLPPRPTAWTSYGKCWPSSRRTG